LRVGERKTGIIYQGDSLVVNNLVARSLDANSVNITPESYEISEQTQLNFSLTLELPLPVGAIIKIGIPSEIQIYEEGTNNAILNSVYGLDPIYRVPQMLITDTVNQIVKISALVPTSDYFVNENNPINFDLMDIINPEATGATSPFTIQVFDQESYMICEVTDNSSLFYQASVGEL
jgi:hypothetical protein